MPAISLDWNHYKGHVRVSHNNKVNAYADFQTFSVLADAMAYIYSYSPEQEGTRKEQEQQQLQQNEPSKQ
jgi:hypothetical protein